MSDPKDHETLVGKNRRKIGFLAIGIGLVLVITAFYFLCSGGISGKLIGVWYNRHSVRQLILYGDGNYVLSEEGLSWGRTGKFEVREGYLELRQERPSQGDVRWQIMRVSEDVLVLRTRGDAGSSGQIGVAHGVHVEVYWRINHPDADLSSAPKQDR